MLCLEPVLNPNFGYSGWGALTISLFEISHAITISMPTCLDGSLPERSLDSTKYIISMQYLVRVDIVGLGWLECGVGDPEDRGTNPSHCHNI